MEEDNRQGGTENQEQDEVKEAVGEAMEKDEAEEEEADSRNGVHRYGSQSDMVLRYIDVLPYLPFKLILGFHPSSTN